MAYRAIISTGRFLAATVVFSVPAWAQEADSEVGRRMVAESCDRAKHGKPQATSKDQKIANIVALQDCGDDGIESLRDYWMQDGADGDVTATLASVSGRLNDRRLYEAARSVLLNVNRPERSRLSALTVLVAGYDPSIAVAFPAPTKPMHSTYVALGQTSHANRKEGLHPVRGYAKSDLPQILERLATSDPNERIRKVAQELGPLLTRRDVKVKG